MGLTKDRIIGIVIGLIALVIVMTATTTGAFADITPITPTYPMEVSTVFMTTDAPSSITDKWGQTYTIPSISTYDDVTYTSSFSTVIPGATSTNHCLLGYPTAMDDIYSCYGSLNLNDYTGWRNVWYTYYTPSSSYIEKMFNVPEIITYYNANKRIIKGYAWMIFMNTYSTANSWNASTRTGKLPLYANNVQIFDGDVVVCRYMYFEETW